MRCNVGGAERITRIVVGAALLLIGFLVPMNTVWQTVVLVIGVIALATGLFRFCPVNALFKHDSCELHKKAPG